MWMIKRIGGWIATDYIWSGQHGDHIVCGRVGWGRRRRWGRWRGGRIGIVAAVQAIRGGCCGSDGRRSCNGRTDRRGAARRRIGRWGARRGGARVANHLVMLLHAAQVMMMVWMQMLMMMHVVVMRWGHVCFSSALTTQTSISDKQMYLSITMVGGANRDCFLKSFFFLILWSNLDF